ncbi:MAG: D-alanine--D-alanine ligase [Candidatus Tectimicrobiota bacterium]|nr:MAG: D-alanine--D-alanine ligase [Candidatus Tectomicrobia bacterium]
MRVALLYGAVAADAGPDEQDTLVQVAALAQALQALGHEAVAVPLTSCLAPAAARLRALRPACVVNLVETVAGSSRAIHLGPQLLERLGLPYTGAAGAVLVATTNKLRTKALLAAAGIATPPWCTEAFLHRHGVPFPGPYIVKSVWEHGSLGLDDAAVVATASQLRALLAQRRHQAAAPWFVERYIAGREFNLALLAGRHGPELLPPAEMLFVDYPADKPRIVDYRAKWEPASFEYRHTQRCFTFSRHEAPLLERLAALAHACWQRLGLAGYARIDVRVDAAGRPWVLEVNANPCLAPDSGFVAAAARAGWALEDVVQRLLAAAQPRAGGK